MSEQQEQDISQIIDTGLEAILSGKMTLEEVLKQHPQQAELLRPELESAVWLVSRRVELAPRAGYIKASRKRVVERIKLEANQRGTKRALFGFLLPQRFVFRAAAAIVVVFMLMMVSGGVVSASQGAIPGEGLYPVKRFAEQVSYQVATDPAERVNLTMRFSEQRLTETQALLAHGDMQQAQISLLEYEQEIQLAVAQLQLVPDTQTQRKGQLAAALQNKLAVQADRLKVLKETAPANAMTGLDQAYNATMSSFSTTVIVFNKMNGIEPTTTPTGTPSLLPTNPAALTPTSPFIATPSPITTLVPGSTESVDPRDSKFKETPTPTDDGRITKTPKPDNTRKPDTPPGQDKEPKPPKENPPPKDDQPPNDDHPPKEKPS